jgi:hypothetical protein
MTRHTRSSAHLALLKNGLCALSIAVAAVLAAGCDSSPTGSGSVSAPASEEAKISGNVQDIHGPIMEGKVEVKDKNGQTILTTQLDGNSNHYSITVPAGTAYPILLIATPVEGSNSQKVRAVVTSPLADRMDITDITTLVVDAAEQLGGLTPENIAKASGGAIGLRQRQGVSAGAGGGGAGPGQSGGGVSRGGHGGHDMSNMGGGSSGSSSDNQSMPGMQH